MIFTSSPTHIGVLVSPTARRTVPKIILAARNSIGVYRIKTVSYTHLIAPNCCFTTAEHPLDPDQRKAGLEIAKPITIGNNVWIGAGSTILAGVTIGDNTVIGAGSVVKKSIPSGVVAVGVPCKKLRNITEADKTRYPLHKSLENRNG